MSDTHWFNRLCKACEQIKRNQRKSDDRARSVIEDRAGERARYIGRSKEFLLDDMNWEKLIHWMRSEMLPGARCPVCNHHYLNSRDIQIDHVLPPRFKGDWAREHVGNLRLICQSCNVAKGKKDFAVSLDDQEAARVSNERSRDGDTAQYRPAQLDLF